MHDMHVTFMFTGGGDNNNLIMGEENVSRLMWLSVFIIILNPFSNEDYLALTTDVQVKNYSAQHEKKKQKHTLNVYIGNVEK